MCARVLNFDLKGKRMRSYFSHSFAPDLGQNTCEWLRLDFDNQIKPYEKQRS